MSMRFLAALMLAAGVSGTAAPPARAEGAPQGFRICNHSSYEVMVAKAVNLTPGG